MVASIEIFRAFAVPGFHEVTGQNTSTFKAWITNSKFKITEIKTKSNFILDVYSKQQLLNAYAFDINRMASASFESVIGISKETYFPKSVGWLIIRLYYAAYFSAHTVLRFFGISCSSLDSTQTQAIDRVYHVLGFDLTNCNTSAAYYACRYDNKTNKLRASQLSNSHQGVWTEFYNFLEALAEKLPSSDFIKSDRDETLVFLLALRERLSNRYKLQSGNWLSSVRNDVNYTHSMGAWFPYSGSSCDQNEMLRLACGWGGQSKGLCLGAISDKDSVMFVETCLAVITLAKEMVLDIDSLNSKSFLANGAVKCLKLCNKR